MPRRAALTGEQRADHLPRQDPHGEDDVCHRGGLRRLLGTVFQHADVVGVG